MKTRSIVGSVLFFAVFALADASEGATVRKGPYLIYPGTNTEMMVLWQLDSSQNCFLEWGLDASYSDGNTVTTEYGTDHQHKHTITGITSGSKYYYRVTVDANQYMGSFQAAPPASATEVEFLAYGDTRTNFFDHEWICKAMIDAVENDPNYRTFTLHVGDYVSDGNDESDWDDEFFNPSCSYIRQMLANLPLNGCVGNHETISDPNAEVYKKYWPYPYVSGCYWSFDYGPAHFAIVDQETTSYEPNSPQLQWLKDDLAGSTKQWKFVVLHRPGYSAGYCSSYVQDLIQPLCEAHGVDIVFAGDNHFYARCDVNGVKHVTTGGGGAPLHAPDPNYADWVEACEKSYHFCKIEISGSRLRLEAVSPNGTVIDIFLLGGPVDPNDHAPPTPNPLTWASEPNAISATTITMTASTATDPNGSLVQYYFNNMTDSNHDSGWQWDSYYQDTGLCPQTEYTYRAKARDMSPNYNETSYSSQTSAATSTVATATTFETFDSDPTNNDWVNASAGNTQFTYNSHGWLDATVYLESGNIARYYKMLDETFDETQEFWFEMDLELSAFTTSGGQKSLFGVFDYTTGDNHHNVIADKFAYKEYSGDWRGNRNDICGYASEGSVLMRRSILDDPNGMAFGDDVRVRGHYWYDSGVGRGTLSIYEIDANDGSTGRIIMHSKSTTLIGLSSSLSFDLFGLGNTTNGTWHTFNKFKADNMYFSIVGENANPVLPSFTDFVLQGDFEPDGDVDSNDLATLAHQWTASCVEPDWCGGCDINQDHIVDFVDFAVLAENWLKYDLAP
jgi:hypothetical protein